MSRPGEYPKISFRGGEGGIDKNNTNTINAKYKNT